MSRVLTTIAALLLAVAAPATLVFAQGTSDKPASAVPPAGRSERSTTSTIPNQPPARAPSGSSSATVKPGPAYNAGTANVGNSSETNGMTGSQGAGASATMQSGHTSNK